MALLPAPEFEDSRAFRRVEDVNDCVYCGCEAEAHDPVYVRHDGTEDAYCNYGCLSAHIDEAGLATGTTCNWDGAASADRNA